MATCFGCSEEREGEVEGLGAETDDEEDGGADAVVGVAVEAVVEGGVEVGIEVEVGVEENTAANAEVFVAGETGEILDVSEGEERRRRNRLKQVCFFYP